MSRIVDTSRRRVVLGVLKCVKNCVIVCQKWVFGDFVKRFLLWILLIFFLWKGKKWKKLKFFLFKNKFLTIFASYSFFVFFIFIVIFQKILDFDFCWILFGTLMILNNCVIWKKKILKKKSRKFFCCVFFEKCYLKINNIFENLKNKNENLWKLKKGKCYL